MIDGNPGWPDLGLQWRLVEETRPTFIGLEPRVRDGVPEGRPRRRAATSTSRSVRIVGVAGSPLPVEGYRVALRAARARDVPANNGSGGTDVCTRDRPGLPAAARVRGRDRGAVPRRRRGRVRRATANEVVGELGELVIRRPMPSMPVEFWNDPDGSRYRAAYFEFYPGRLAPRRLDPVRRARQRRSSPAAPTRR